jgi:hypothetical protein
VCQNEKPDVLLVDNIVTPFSPQEKTPSVPLYERGRLCREGDGGRNIKPLKSPAFLITRYE